MPDDTSPPTRNKKEIEYQKDFKEVFEENLETFLSEPVYEVCVPRNEVISMAADTTIIQALDIFKAHLFSRYPIHERNNPDEIIGILNIKDILLHLGSKKALTVSKIMKEAYFVSFSEPISQVFKKMQTNKVKMSLVVNEYGEMDGLVVAEDLLEILVGRIYDEYEQGEPILLEETENKLKIDGKYELSDLNEKYGTDLISDEVETISGYISHSLGRIPSIGETFTLNDLTFTILKSDNKKVDLVTIVINK